MAFQTDPTRPRRGGPESSTDNNKRPLNSISFCTIRHKNKLLRLHSGLNPLVFGSAVEMNLLPQFSGSSVASKGNKILQNKHGS